MIMFERFSRDLNPVLIAIWIYEHSDWQCSTVLCPLLTHARVLIKQSVEHHSRLEHLTSRVYIDS